MFYKVTVDLHASFIHDQTPSSVTFAEVFVLHSNFPLLSQGFVSQIASSIDQLVATDKLEIPPQGRFVNV